MRSIRNGICLSLLCACLFLAASVPALATEDTLDPSRTGSLSVTLQDSGAALTGAEITLYKVADAKGQELFTYTKDFQAFGEPMESLTNDAAAQRLADYVQKQGHITGMAVQTDAHGKADFPALSLGYYLAMQTGHVSGWSDCAPFLVSIPIQTDGRWVYDIDATPKTDVTRPVTITVQKVWNDNGQNRPDSVSIQLLRGDAVVDTVTLNEGNNWRYTWPDQPQSDAWSVKEIHVPKGYTATYQQNSFVFTVTNTPMLIQTGQLNWPIPLLAGAGLWLFIGGWILYVKWKRKNV